jgi:retron-type reverse transcriptase
MSLFGGVCFCFFNGFNSIKSTDISSLLSEQAIDILALNENHSSRPNILSYHRIFHPNSNDLLIYVHSTVSFTIIDILSEQEFDLISLVIDRNVFLFSYLRNGKSAYGISKLIEYLSNISINYNGIYIIGDLNARLFSLGHQRRNTAGVFLENFLDSSENFIVLNQPQVTTFERPSNFDPSVLVQSVLDLCIASSGSLERILHFEVLNHRFTSDHYPILLSIGTSKHIPHSIRSAYFDLYPLRKYALQHVEFPESFSNILNNELEHLELNYPPLTAEDLWEQVKLGIFKALKKAKLLKQSSNRKKFLKLPSDILELRQNNPSEFRRKIKQFKLAKWKNFIQSIHESDSMAHVWHKFKISRGLPPLKLTRGDPSIEVEFIRSNFQSYSSPDIALPLHININENLQIEDPLSTFNAPISMTELSYSIAKFSNSSSPGPDGISYSVFKQFSSSCKRILLNLVNQFFNDGFLPKNLKQALQIAFPKPSGDFRPITLMNCFLKIYESILYQRLYAFIDSLLPYSQFGFRRNRSSYDQAAALINFAESQRNLNLYVGIIFIDIKKAFDRVDRNILLQDMFEVGIRGKMLRAVSSVISNSSLRVLFNDFVSSDYSTEFGTPQGSILSPLLWNFYFRKFETNVHNGRCFQFADDIAVAYAHSSFSQMITGLTADFSRSYNWCFDNRIEISTDKTKFMDLSKKHLKKRRRSEPIRFRNRFTNSVSGALKGP